MEDGEIFPFILFYKIAYLVLFLCCSTDRLLEEQRDELEVLQSIFPEEFEEYNGSDGSTPLTHKIHLLPEQSGGENYGLFLVF